MSNNLTGQETPIDNPANSQTSILKQIRRPLSEAVGLSALIFIFGNIINAPIIIMSLLAIFFVMVWVFAWAGKKFFRDGSIFLLTILCLVLATVLAWVVVIHFYEDRWRGWNNEMLASIKDCAPDNANCLVKAFKHDYPEQQFPSISSKLNNDLKAGSYFLQDEKIKAMLGKRLGIYDAFLGTGFAQPHDTKEYEDARIPEYLCPNSPQSEGNVITWALNPSDEYLEWTLEEIIEGKKIVKKIIDGKEVVFEAQPINSKAKRDGLLSLIQGRLDLTAKEPAVVRFQQLAASSEKVGHPDAARVFFSHLGGVWKMKLRDAARLSGYTLDSNAEKKFFIWVYLPRHSDEVVPATWKNVLKHFKDERKPWIKAEETK